MPQADAAGDVGFLLRRRVFGHDHAAAGEDAVGIGDVEALVFGLDAILFADFIGDREGFRRSSRRRGRLVGVWPAAQRSPMAG